MFQTCKAKRWHTGERGPLNVTHCRYSLSREKNGSLHSTLFLTSTGIGQDVLLLFSRTRSAAVTRPFCSGVYMTKGYGSRSGKSPSTKRGRKERRGLWNWTEKWGHFVGGLPLSFLSDWCTCKTQIRQHCPERISFSYCTRTNSKPDRILNWNPSLTRLIRLLSHNQTHRKYK